MPSANPERVPVLLEDVPKCSVPLIWEDPTFGYWRNGSGFLVTYKGQLFLVTARHCVRNREAHTLRIMADLGGTRCLPVDVQAMPTDDADYADFAILSLLSNANPATNSDPVPFKLDGGEATAKSHPGAILTVRGFPAEAPCSLIDYDARKIHVQAAVFDATAAGVDATGGKYRLKYVEGLPLSYLGGLSGSPVFLREKTESRLFRYRLCGVLTQGPTPPIGHFVAISLIVTALEILCRRVASLSIGQ
jgi:hypothetical protein